MIMLGQAAGYRFGHRDEYVNKPYQLYMWNLSLLPDRTPNKMIHRTR